MRVLALRLAGPLQSWGSAARFARRTTENAPTKSGVIGLLAAAQGRGRTSDLADLAALRFGVRVDQPGVRLRDYQTAHHADTGNAMPVSERFYLADALFVAAVAGEDALVEDLHRAIQRPVYLPYLGRRSCPPSRPLEIGVYPDLTIEQVLGQVEWQAAAWHQCRHRRKSVVELRTFVDAAPGAADATTLRDLPLSFDPLHRRYALRGMRSGIVQIPNPQSAPQASIPPDHNPMPPLGGD